MISMSIKYDSKKILSTPGIYIFYQGKTPIYIGKAADLKKRLASYFRANAGGKVWQLREEATKLEWRELSSEVEALIEEASLIKRYQPKFNVLLRDDKNYFYVGLTKETFPRIFLTHQPTIPLIRTNKGYSKKYIGPFTNGNAIKSTLKLLRRVFPYCTCVELHKRRCLNAQIERCLGFCCDKNKLQTANNKLQNEYRKNIKNIEAVLSGKRVRLLSVLKKQMRDVARRQLFERAGKLRDQIEGIENIFKHRQFFELPRRITQWTGISHQLGVVLGMTESISRIEGYDISNIQGQFAVGSMIVFNNGEPEKSAYRKFKIRTVLPNEGGDVAMLREMLTRRFKHAEWPRPDVIVVDGGKAQWSAVRRVVPDIPVIALTKDARHHGHHIFFSSVKEPIPLNNLPMPVANLILRVDDEAHRFAIRYYRTLHRRTIS